MLTLIINYWHQWGTRLLDTFGSKGLNTLERVTPHMIGSHLDITDFRCKSIGYLFTLVVVVVVVVHYCAWCKVSQCSPG